MRYRWTRAGAQLLAALVLAFAPCRSAFCETPPDKGATGDRLEVTLRPVVDGGQVTAIEVHSVIHGSQVPDSGPFSVTAPVVYAAVAGIADRVRELTLRDSQGEIPLSQEDDPPAAGGFPYYRHWRANRSVSFPVTISYRSEVEPDDAGPAPPFGIRPSAGGISGAGSGFLVLPENVTSTISRVQWDLSFLPPGSAGITSFGEGAFEVDGPPEELMQGWYMAGPVQRYPASGDDNGFSASWLGDFPFDPAGEMQWAGEAYAYLGDFFEYLDPRPRYRVFMRMLDSSEGSAGTALPNSFMLSRGPAAEGETGAMGPRDTFVHEMIHQWIGHIEGTIGIISWFSEGLTTYYTSLLPMLGEFRTMDDYGEAINALARAYYMNPSRNWSGERIAKSGFGNEQARRTPYQRGALYFANLDSQIRAASGGAENLHSFMREIFTRREEEENFLFDHDKWKELIAARLGQDAVEEFSSIIVEGKTIIPASDAFGPCFERQPAVFTSEDAEAFSGFKWVRIESMPDRTCRENVTARNFSGHSFVSTQHGSFNGAAIDYTAAFEEVVLSDEDGRKTASVFGASYVRRNTLDPASRPVIFVWNGGPGAASQTLHIAGFGPRRLVAPLDVTAPVGPPYETVENRHTLLDAADLVFVDPVETGFSRILPHGDRNYFYSASGDAESIAQFIREWLKREGREASPKYVMGSSYGSIRAALVAGLLTESATPLEGAILLSQGVNLVETTQRKNNLIGFAVNMPQIAATAWYHGKTSRQHLSVADVIDETYDFAMSEYLVALVKGSSLKETERKAIAKKLEELTGISAAYYLGNRLTIDKQTFGRELLKGEGRGIGQADARYTAAVDDPEGPAIPTRGVSIAFRNHLRDFLGVTLPNEEYRSYAPDIGQYWDYEGWSTLDGSRTPRGARRSIFADFDYPGELQRAFEANDSFRVMIATGIYDTLTTTGPARLLAATPGYPTDRIVLYEYVGGHAFYSNDAEFERLADDVREFVSH